MARSRVGGNLTYGVRVVGECCACVSGYLIIRQSVHRIVKLICAE